MPTPSSDRPNILFIMDDQHRFDYLGCAGASFVSTPHIDALAERGMRFTQCCCSSPVCVPSRLSLATGLRPGRVGTVGNNGSLPDNVASYYQRLRDAEYRVGLVGKVDLNKGVSFNGRKGDRPSAYRFGFTDPVECEGKMHAGKFPTPQGPYGFHLEERGLYKAFHEDYKLRSEKGWIVGVSHDSVLPTDAFEDIYIGQRSVEWLETRTEEYPWHLFVSFVGPHDPFDPPTEYAEKYRDKPMPATIPERPKPNWVEQKRKGYASTAEQIAHTQRQYCAAIEAVDDQVGAIVATLERKGMLENTYIVFSSDHGEMLGDHGLYQKSVGYEAALRVPLIVAGPGIAEGKETGALVELMDLNPTICEWAGLPTQPNIQGMSLAAVARGEQDALRSATVSELENLQLIRTERYKLILNHNDTTELYDLKEDPNELNNIAKERRDLVGELRGQLRKELKN